MAIRVVLNRCSFDDANVVDRPCDYQKTTAYAHCAALFSFLLVATALRRPRHIGLSKAIICGGSISNVSSGKKHCLNQKHPMPAHPKPSFNQVAEITLHYQRHVKPSHRPKVTCSSDAYSIFMNHWHPHQLELQEEFKVMLLNWAHKVLGIVNISLGGIAGTIADPKLIFAAALTAGSSSLI